MLLINLTGAAKVTLLYDTLHNVTIRYAMIRNVTIRNVTIPNVMIFYFMIVMICSDML